MDSRKVCFVIAPIGDPGSEIRKRSDLVLKHVVRPAVEECGYYAMRADEIDKPGIIASQVIQHIINDPLVIADLTGRNPNVFYELALRHAIRKPLVQIIQLGEALPFDVAATRTIMLDHTDLDNVEAARIEIKKQIIALEQSPTTIETPVSVTLDLQLLRQSDNPDDRSIAGILASVTEIRTAVGQLTTSLGTEQVGPLLTAIRQTVITLSNTVEENLLSRRGRERRSLPSLTKVLMETHKNQYDPIGILILFSYLREDFPWLFESAAYTYRVAKTGSRGDTTIALKKLRQDFELAKAFALDEPKGLRRQLNDTFELIGILLDEFAIAYNPRSGLGDALKGLVPDASTTHP